ncbi:MAG: MMPL family transporter [Pseudomonadales bacterium]
MSTATPATRLAVLLTVLLGLFALVLWRLSLTYDLAYFLPAPTTPAQQVLTERLGANPGTDLLFIELPGRSKSAATALATQLRSSNRFGRVWPGSESGNFAELPNALWDNRLLLGDLPASMAEWRTTLNDRLADISSAPDEQLLALIAADPALLAVNALAPLRNSFDINALRNADPPLLVLQPQSGAFAIDAQVQIYAALQDQLADAGIGDARLYGSGIYSVELQSAVRGESIIFSVLASVALAALIVWRFRSGATLLAAALPLAIGGVSGLLVLSLVFHQVHGITLAFGFTLLGVALDYPLHLLVHQQLRPGAATNQLWSTMRLGIVSTIIAYGAFLLSGTGGLAQLGLFASVGIAAAALATLYLDSAATLAPRTELASSPPQARTTTAPQLSHGPWLLALALAIGGTGSSYLFNDDLGAMTPVPKATLAADSALRQKLGTIDLRHLITVRAADLETVLQRTESLDASLARAQSSGTIERYRSITQLLPSQVRQTERRSALANSDTIDDFRQALATTPFADAAFAPFFEAVTHERKRSDWLTVEALQAEPLLAELVDSQLYQSGQEWVSLVYLSGLNSPAALIQSLPTAAEITLVDLKAASVTLVQGYRNRLLLILGMAGLLVGLLLWQRTGNLRRTLWLLGTMTAAVATSICGNLLLGSTLSLFDLMALALVAGLGLDYALFFSRDDGQAKSDSRATRQAVLLCAASSLLVFGILSLSSIPLLQGIGRTVAVGVAAAWLLARVGRYENPATRSSVGGAMPRA